MQQPNLRQPVILSAVRTPVGKFQGALSSFSATELGARVVAEVTHRAGIEPDAVDEVIMGNVVQAGLGQNPARQAALRGGVNSAGRRHDDQQSLRLGTQGGRAGRAGRDARRKRHRRRRRNGIDVQLPLFAAGRARRLSHWRSPSDRFHDSRRTLGCLRRLSHGHDRRARGREIQNFARRAGQIRSAKAISEPCRR